VEPAFGGIGLEQDAGVSQLASGGLASSDEVVKELSFFVSERDFVPFHDRFPEEMPHKRH
jgi:hypothetical protein